jgi:hypothetical protein
MLHSKFTSLSNKNCTFESVRDFIRYKLNQLNPLLYRYGTRYTDIDALVREFTSSKKCESSFLHCRNCKLTLESPHSYLSDYTAVGWCSSDRDKLQGAASIQEYLNYKIIRRDKITNKSCLRCRNDINKEFPLYNTRYINELPTVLIFALAPWIDINQRLQFHVSNAAKEYILKGIIYSNENHFTARLIDESHTVWYHDGQTTRSVCQKEDSLSQIDDIVYLKSNREYKAILAFYIEQIADR